MRTQLCFRPTNVYSLILAAIGLVCLASTPDALAEDSSSDNLRLSGFGTIGLVNSGDEQLGFRRDITKSGVFDQEWSIEPDSVLGLQIGSTFSDKLSGVLQLVAKDRAETTLDNSVEWAFLRYDHNPDLAIRVGRMGADLFMLSEYRNVGFAYLWARPPVEFYGALGFESYDGLDVNFSKRLSDGLLQVKLFAGQSNINVVAQTGVIDLDFKNIFGANLTWESTKWRSRLVYLETTFDSPIDSITPLIEGLLAIPSFVWPAAAELAAQLDTQDKVLRYYAAGAAYESSPWVVQSELGFVSSGADAAFPDLFTAYLSVGRQLSPSITVYGLGAIAENTQDTLEVPAEPSGGTNPQLVALQQGIQLFADQTGIHQHSLSLGMRKDLRHNLALKLQWDRTWVRAFGTALWDQSFPASQDLTVDTISVNLSFVF